MFEVRRYFPGDVVSITAGEPTPRLKRRREEREAADVLRGRASEDARGPALPAAGHALTGAAEHARADASAGTLAVLA